MQFGFYRWQIFSSLQYISIFTIFYLLIFLMSRYHTAKSQSSKKNLLLSSQWLYNDGWIQLRSNNQLVLGISQYFTEVQHGETTRPFSVEFFSACFVFYVIYYDTGAINREYVSKPIVVFSFFIPISMFCIAKTNVPINTKENNEGLLNGFPCRIAWSMHLGCCSTFEKGKNTLACECIFTLSESRATSQMHG